MHIYWAGGFYYSVDEYLYAEYGKRLLSYHYLDSIKGYIKLFECETNVDKQYLIIDSGAFSAWNSGKEINIKEYVKFLVEFDKKYSCLFDEIYYVGLDVIPGEPGIVPTIEDRKNSAEKGLGNLYYMLDHLSVDKIIHVFHMYEDFEFIDRIIEKVSYMGVSPANDVGQPVKEKWMSQVFNYIRGKNVKTHGFAVTAIRSMKKFQWTSVDSASLTLLAGWGKIMTPWGSFFVSDRKENESLINQPFTVKNNVIKYIESLGFKYEELVGHKERRLFNIKYLINLDKEINKNRKTIVQKGIF